MILNGEKKYCSGCKTIKRVDEFGTNKSKDDGLNNLCVLCNRDYMRNYYHIKKKNNEKYKTYNQKYNQKYKQRIKKDRHDRYRVYVEMMAKYCERTGLSFVPFKSFAITDTSGRVDSQSLRRAIVVTGDPRVVLHKVGRTSGFKYCEIEV